MHVSIRELKANPARAIALMQQGQRVQITSHRKVVAELVQPKPASDNEALLSDEAALQRLFESGAMAQMPTQPLRLCPTIAFQPGPNGQTMSELVLEMRGPRCVPRLDLSNAPNKSRTNKLPADSLDCNRNGPVLVK